MSTFTRIKLGFFLFVALLGNSPNTHASLNLMGGVSSSVGLGNIPSQTIFMSGEMTLNIFRVIEGGIFYDHNIADSTSFNLLGVVGRVGLGSISGLYVDGKVGVTPSTMGVGAAMGIGYRISEYVGVRVGPRFITGVLGGQVIGDVGLMVSL